MKAHLETLKAELEAGTAQLLDVRELNEWDEGHLVVAKLVPLSQLQLGHAPEDIEHSKKTYLHCRSGKRVYSAHPLLRSLGFSEVIALNEGFTELVSEGFKAA